MRIVRLGADRAGDLAVAVLVVASVAEAWFSVDQTKWLSVPLALGWSATLFLRRRSGLAAGLLAIGFVVAADLVFPRADETNTMFLAVLAAFGVIGMHEERSRAVAGGIVGFVVLILLFAYVILSKMGYIYQWTNGRLGEPRQTQADAAPKATTAPEPPAKAVEAPK